MRIVRFSHSHGRDCEPEIGSTGKELARDRNVAVGEIALALFE